MKDAIGDRMKAYENVSKNVFIKRMPVIIRLDGKGFSKYTKPLKDKTKPDPFNKEMHHLMRTTTLYLLREMQNSVVAYTQSDEISILLKDWETFETDQWFGGKQSKIESISSSIATAVFNYAKRISNYCPEITSHFALFDARAFQIPKEDVTNYFLWRQQDCIRNSVQMLAQHHFSHKSLQGLNIPKLREKLLGDKNINWYELEAWKQNGTFEHKSGNSDTGLITNNRNMIEQYLQA